MLPDCGGVKAVVEVLVNGCYRSVHDVDSLKDAAYELIDEGYWGVVPDYLKEYMDLDKMEIDLDCQQWYYHNKTRIAFQHTY